MRFFRRSRDAKASSDRRASLEEGEAPKSDERSIVPASRRPPPESGAEPKARVEPARADAGAPSRQLLENSDVFVAAPADASAKRAAREVTLFVHRWHNVEPGLLSWTFPSLRAALDAVQRMKNAIGWCVVSGTGWTDLDAARASGAVLVEQLS